MRTQEEQDHELMAWKDIGEVSPPHSLKRSINLYTQLVPSN